MEVRTWEDRGIGMILWILVFKNLEFYVVWECKKNLYYLIVSFIYLIYIFC